MTLYNDTRPRKLADLIGQPAVIKTVEGWLKSGDLPSAIGFFGPSGVGKTTLARIICKKAGVDKGDLMRLSAASETMGVDGIRQAARISRRSPMYGARRGVFIDEAHQLTPAAQEALLVPIEETKDSCHWWLSTTEPEKLIKPLRSRLAVLTFEKLQPAAIERIVTNAVAAIDGELSKKVIAEIVLAADGNGRAAVQLAEKAMACEAEDEQLEVVAGGDDPATKAAIDIARALAGRSNWATIAKLLRENTSSPETTRRVVLGYCKSCLLGGKDAARHAQIIRYFKDPLFDAGADAAQLAAICYLIAEPQR